MSRVKSQKPSVVTYFDHEVITPPNKLRHAISSAPKDQSAVDPVVRAEQALAQLSSEFSGWMDTEIERLDQARQLVKTIGFNRATREALFHAAHDIKGEAATFGFPWVASLAESLSRLIEHTPDMHRIPLTLVDQHVDAVRAIIRESARPDIAGIADELTRRLREVTDEFLRRENRERPDYLDGILAPPIAPSDPPF
jgi:chemotaxis protein histidine kinase CheA